MYEIPTGEQLRDFLRKYNLTGAAAAAIVGVDSRTVRKWTASGEAANRRAMPWSAWVLLRLFTGEVSIESYRQEVVAV